MIIEPGEATDRAIGTRGAPGPFPPPVFFCLFFYLLTNLCFYLDIPGTRKFHLIVFCIKFLLQEDPHLVP